MNLKRIAWNNVWHNRGRYLAHLGSAAFAVMVYFLFNAVVLHPDFQGGYRGARMAAEAMEAGAVVVAAFTSLFLAFANSAFIRFRRREFGLLRLMGFTRGQLVRLLLWEGVITGAAALAIGCGLGLLFARLFFLGISALLRFPEAVPVYAGAAVWLRTAAVFGAVFLVVSLLSIRDVMKYSIAGLLRARRRTRVTPTFSRWKVAAGALLLGLGYAWASLSSQEYVFPASLPVTVMVSGGTYLLIHEGSIALLDRLRRDPQRFYRPVPFLHLSQLQFKLKDNARTLTAVALLVAVILTAMGTIASIYGVVRDDVRTAYVHSLQVGRTGPDAALLEGDARRIRSLLEEHGLDVRRQWYLLTAWAELANPQMEMSLVLAPYSFYRDMREARGADPQPAPAPGGALLVASTQRQFEDGRAYTLIVGDQHLEVLTRVDQGPLLFSHWTLVVADDTFADLVAQAPEDHRVALAAWTTVPELGWPALEAHAQVWELLDDSGRHLFFSMAERHDREVSQWAAVLFMAVFTSLVFFAACCSLLYFRLHTEIDDDRRHYRRLAELGVDGGVLRQVTRRQLLTVFFVPFGIGLVHFTFAMRALSTAAGQSVLRYIWLVAAAYLVLYGVYFLAVQGFYWRSLRLEA